MYTVSLWYFADDLGNKQHTGMQLYTLLFHSYCKTTGDVWLFVQS